MLAAKVIDLFRVPADGKFKLKDHDPAWSGSDATPDLSKKELKHRARELLAKDLEDHAASANTA